MQNLFCCLRFFFFDIQLKNTSTLTLLSFKVPPERFFQKVSKQVLLFYLCGVKSCKIESEIVNILVGHSVKGQKYQCFGKRLYANM